MFSYTPVISTNQGMLPVESRWFSDSLKLMPHWCGKIDTDTDDNLYFE
jgi:hypothetical protein